MNNVPSVSMASNNVNFGHKIKPQQFKSSIDSELRENIRKVNDEIVSSNIIEQMKNSLGWLPRKIINWQLQRNALREIKKISQGDPFKAAQLANDNKDISMKAFKKLVNKCISNGKISKKSAERIIYWREMDIGIKPHPWD